MKLVIQGSTFADWQEVDLDSDVMTPADGWQVKARLPERRFLELFREGGRVDLYVDDDRQLRGVIDDVQISLKRDDDTLLLRGRDLGGLLVDSEAVPFSAKNYTLQALAEKLVRPHGIRRVVLSNAANRLALMGRQGAAKSHSGSPFGDEVRAATAIPPGKKVAQILDEHTKRRGIAWWLTAEGDLFLGRPDYRQEVAFKFLCFDAADSRSKQNNCEVEIVRSWAERYSHLTIVGQGAAASTNIFADATPTAKQAKFRQTAEDPDLVARGIDRRTTIHDGDVLNRKQAEAHAAVEMGRRRMGGLVLRVSTAGWSQEGRIFTVDTLASVRIPAANIEGVFWVGQRRLRESRGERRTDLTLYQKGLWLP